MIIFEKYVHIENVTIYNEDGLRQTMISEEAASENNIKDHQTLNDYDYFNAILSNIYLKNRPEKIIIT